MSKITNDKSVKAVKLPPQVALPPSAEVTQKHEEDRDDDSFIRELSGTISAVLSRESVSGPASAVSMLKHLRGFVAPRPGFKVEELASMLNLHFIGDSRKAKLVSKSGKFFRIVEDRAFSSRCLIETALVIVVNTLDPKRPVSTSFSAHDRLDSIERLRPYSGIDGKSQFFHYLTLLAGSERSVVYARLDGATLVDRMTGELTYTGVSSGGSYEICGFDRSKVRSFISYCEQNDISFRLKLDEPYQAKDLVANVGSLTIKDIDKAIVEYVPPTRNRTAPLVPGPEKEAAVLSAVNLVMQWVGSGDASYDRRVVAPVPAGKVCSEAMSLYEDMIDVTKTPQENRFAKMPPNVKALYYKALRAGPDAGAVLQEANIGYDKAGIYAAGAKVYRKVVPRIIMDTIKRVVDGLAIPTARMTLKYVHFVLTTKELFSDKGGALVERLPVSPWYAAVNIICRYRHKYKMDDIVEHGGEIYHAPWARDNLGISINEVPSTPVNKKKRKAARHGSSRQGNGDKKQPSNSACAAEEGRATSGAQVANTVRPGKSSTPSAVSSGNEIAGGSGSASAPTGSLPKLIVAEAVVKAMR